MDLKEQTIFTEIALKYLSEEDFIKIEKHSVQLKFKKGETILKQGHQPTHIAFLQSGIVKFNYSGSNQKNTILTLVSAPKILGGANLFYRDNYLFSFIAIEDSDVILIETNVLFEIMKTNSIFSMALFQLASDMFKKAIMNFISVANKQKESRIADIILYLSEEIYCNTRFQLSLTRKELAEFACCSAENVIMTLSRWQNERILSIFGKTLTIIDLDKLKYISNLG
ncbi:MAG: Crp/Fnr family transcriptional regulator [Bacteroidales bacterium]|jgi:CRP/FNR family transcriptional regulator|nr:Crp/Fnr family transcriptional regulator [Bacteroidales bacterium]